MKPVVLTLAVLSATITLPSPSPAQEAEPPQFAVQSVKPGPERALPSDPDVEEALALRIEEALESHRRNRLLGSGLVAAGAAAVVGALVDWSGHNRLGMRPGAAATMFGGVSLVVWGADRHVAAREALRRAERLQTR